MNEITIASTNVTVKEYQGQRVVTFKDIDTVSIIAKQTPQSNHFSEKKRAMAKPTDGYGVCRFLL